MHNHRISFFLLLCFAPAAKAQHTITTVAGGVLNNIPATSAGLVLVSGVVEDSKQNLFLTSPATDTVYKVAFPSGQLTTIAGKGEPGFSGDGGPAVNAELNSPGGIAIDNQDDVYIADTLNDCVREIGGPSSTIGAGNIKTIAGICGSSGSSGNGVAATSATLNGPEGVFVDAQFNIYIADSTNNCIREVGGPTNATIGAGKIATIAGTCGSAEGTNGSGAATTWQFNFPWGIWADSTGSNVYIADSLNNCIRQMVVAAQTIQPIAGSCGAGPNTSGDGGLATAANLCHPGGLFMSRGTIFVADTCSNEVRVFTVGGNIGNVLSGLDLSVPQGVFVDTSGNIFIADTGNFVIRELVRSPFSVQVVAGNGTSISGTGPATGVPLNGPTGIFLDPAGDMYISDSGSNVIREVGGPSNAQIGAGTTAVVAGNGNPFLVFNPTTIGDSGLAIKAHLELAERHFVYESKGGGVSVDSTGNIFISDTYDFRVRRVAAADGTINTFAGSGPILPDYGDFGGDGGPATMATLNFTSGVFVDKGGNVFLADTWDNRIREVTTDLKINTVAGTGVQSTATDNGSYGGDGGLATMAHLNTPVGVVGDLSGNLYFADVANQRIRKFTVGGNINTVAGGGTAGLGEGGPATNATLNTPLGVYVDSAGDIFIAEADNNRIREVDTSGNIHTVVGNGTAGFSGDNGDAINAELSLPAGVFGDVNGNLYIADSGNNRIRKVAGLVSVVGVQVQVMPPSPNCFVMPDSSTGCYVLPGGMQQFAAPVTGALDTSVKWSVCPGGACGTIDPGKGLYVAPAPSVVSNSTTVTVTATSNADSTKSGTATVLIPTPPKITANPTNAPSLTAGQQQTADVALTFSGGTGDAFLRFSSFSCSVSPVGDAPASFKPSCVVPTPSVTLLGDGTGNGPVHVTITAPASATLYVTPQIDLRLGTPFVFLTLLCSLTLMLLRMWGKANRFALLLVAAVAVFSMNGCSGGGKSGGGASPGPTSFPYTITVTASSNSVTPPLQANVNFGATVLAPPGVFQP